MEGFCELLTNPASAAGEKGHDMSEYTKQADDFCKKYGVKIDAKFLFYGPYFDDDETHRDVYEITIYRDGKKPWVFKFGQSIAKSKQNRTPPKEYDVLACIQKSDIGTIEDFCCDFGYNEDSLKARETYFNVQKEWNNCARTFGDVIEELQEIN